MRSPLFAFSFVLGLLALAAPSHAQKPKPGTTPIPKLPFTGGAPKTPAVVTAARTAQAAASAMPSGVRFTARAPDAMVNGQKVRALAGDEAQALAAVATLEHLSETSTQGNAERALIEVYKASGNVEVKHEAALAVRRLSAEEGTAAAYPKAHALGLLTDVVVAGPFRDTGGGIDAHEGPEKEKDFGYPKSSWSWSKSSPSWVWTPVLRTSPWR